jgi:hypothetical protein
MLQGASLRALLEFLTKGEKEPVDRHYLKDMDLI